MISFTDTEASMKNNDISSFENKFDLLLPEGFKNHIKKFNGGFCSHSYFNGLNINLFLSMKHGDEGITIESTLETLSDILPDSFMPFANDSGGNLIGFFLDEEKNEEVFIWYHDMGEGEDLKFLSDSFENFMDALTKEPHNF